MPSVFSESFDGIASGTTISTTNTSFSSVTIGAGATFQSTSGGYTGQAALINTSSSGVTAVKNWTAISSSKFIRVYLKIESYPPNHMGIMSIRSGTTILANIQLSTSGNVRVRNGVIISSTSTTQVPLNQWFRLEWSWNAGTSSQAIRIFSGANTSTSTYDEQVTGAATAGNADNSAVGILDATSNGALYIDEYAYNDTDWVGPVSATSTSWIKRANGGVWTDVDDFHAAGGTWV